ncbi:hypothetical protein ACN4EE_03045 [Geminocystis sp. CENA526]|uniref:hypothetical protein n=1 Tax=Geminocystis sp. CENA526 TaxID=1355871 RepID=UPI003D6E74F5
MTQVTIPQETKEEVTNTTKEVYFTDILQEIQAIPQEYWSNLLQILRSFREVTDPSTVKKTVHLTNNLFANYDPSKQEEKNKAALELLRRWREEGDEEEQTEAWEILSKAFDIHDNEN